MSSYHFLVEALCAAAPAGRAAATQHRPPCGRKALAAAASGRGASSGTPASSRETPGSTAAQPGGLSQPAGLGALVPLEVPAGLSCLLFQGSGAGPGSPRITRTLPRGKVPLVRLEEVRIQNQRFLLMASPPELRPRVNGHPVPRLAALRVRDQVQFDARTVLHLTLHHRPELGPAPAESVGKECPVCRVPFAHDTRVLLCSNCRSPLHCEDDKPQDDRLECARLSLECPLCKERLRWTEGYVYVPEHDA